MSTLTRRELLARLSCACAMSVIPSPKKDWFDRELVCIHIFGPTDSVPFPLVEKPSRAPGPRPARGYFELGWPELILCTTRVKFLELFQYFWPFTRQEFQQLQGAIRIEFKKLNIGSAADVEEFLGFLREHKDSLRRSGARLAVLFTFNDYTRNFSSSVVAACREHGVDELVLLKDPSRAPYLCDFPSRQKGFKKPPP